MPEAEFEQRVAEAVNQLAGPSRPVDGRAIEATVRQRASRRRPAAWGDRVPLIAAAVAALVLGLGLVTLVEDLPDTLSEHTGSTAMPASVGRPDLRSFTTEQVEPAVRRLLDDGAGHRISGLPQRAVAVGHGGGAWLLTLEETIALGRDGSLPALPVREVYGWPEATSDGEGNLWATWCGAAPYSLEGGEWKARPTPVTGCVSSLSATDEGVVFAALPVADGEGPLIAYRRDGDWSFLPTIDDRALRGSYGDWFVAASETDVWFANGAPDGEGTSTRGLLHFDGTSWSEVSPLVDDAAAAAGPLALGADGTLWVFLRQEGSDALGSRFLARLDAEGWDLFGTAEGVPNLAPSSRPVVDRHGRLWMGLADLGVAAFDGLTWERYLDGSTIRDLAVAPDGLIWAMTESELYVIDPTPVADQPSEEVMTAVPSPRS